MWVAQVNPYANRWRLFLWQMSMEMIVKNDYDLCEFNTTQFIVIALLNP